MVHECGHFDVDQFAYLKKRSATQALLLLVEKVKKGMLNGEKAGAVFFISPMPSAVSIEHGCCTRLAKILELLEDYFFIFKVF